MSYTRILPQILRIEPTTASPEKPSVEYSEKENMAVLKREIKLEKRRKSSFYQLGLHHRQRSENLVELFNQCTQSESRGCRIL